MKTRINLIKSFINLTFYNNNILYHEHKKQHESKSFAKSFY